MIALTGFESLYKLTAMTRHYTITCAWFLPHWTRRVGI